MNNELNRLSEEEFKTVEKNKVILVADNIRSALNIGSLFRTADAFRIEEILLVGICAVPPNRDIAKTALGAEKTVVWKHFSQTGEALAYLKQREALVLCLEQVAGSVSLNDFRPEKQMLYALVAGSEIGGVGEAWIAAAHQSIEIPQWGTKHSLNVSVAAGIALWELSKSF